MAFAILFLSAPMAKSDLTRMSTETLKSPFTILATLDWLDFSILANCACVNLLCLRCFVMARLSASLNSIYSDSSALSPRSSPTEPTLYPLDYKAFFFIIILFLHFMVRIKFPYDSFSFREGDQILSCEFKLKFLLIFSNQGGLFFLPL